MDTFFFFAPFHLVFIIIPGPQMCRSGNRSLVMGFEGLEQKKGDGYKVFSAVK